ncbi:hypothetical protein DFJ73DRAFT_766187, partial [Zopfochytrium polystomum]
MPCPTHFQPLPLSPQPLTQHCQIDSPATSPPPPTHRQSSRYPPLCTRNSDPASPSAVVAATNDVDPRPTALSAPPPNPTRAQTLSPPATEVPAATGTMAGAVGHSRLLYLYSCKRSFQRSCDRVWRLVPSAIQLLPTAHRHGGCWCGCSRRTRKLQTQSTNDLWAGAAFGAGGRGLSASGMPESQSYPAARKPPAAATAPYKRSSAWYYLQTIQHQKATVGMMEASLSTTAPVATDCHTSYPLPQPPAAPPAAVVSQQDRLLTVTNWFAAAFPSPPSTMSNWVQPQPTVGVVAAIVDCRPHHNRVIKMQQQGGTGGSSR